ncbi:hypothetical protein IWW51_005650 [Coemansia sp. RSA 2702]|nr:hypothetical protein IWW51_005650 [Coemansia sp. RSA 2702]
MPLYVSVDPADMWEPKNGADGSAGAAEGEAAEGAGTRKGKVITDEDLCVLTNVVHGSSLGMLRLVEELKRLIPGATKAQIERLIHEHAKKEKRPPTTRSQWYVNAELVDRLRSMKLLATPTSDSADSVRAPERSVADFFGAVTNSSASTPAFEHGAKRQRTGSLECDNGAQHTPSQECAPAGIPHTTAS